MQPRAKEADLLFVKLSDASSTTAQSAAAPLARCEPSLARCFGWLTRPRRILLVLGAVWVINVFDLGYTLLESMRKDFVEVNPVAAQLVGTSPSELILYKTALVVTGSVILLVHRRHRIAELGCWFLLGAYLFVAIRWWLYYEHLLEALANPAVNVDPLIGYCPL